MMRLRSNSKSWSVDARVGRWGVVLTAAALAVSLLAVVPVRPAVAAAPDFTIGVLPDTQHYSLSYPATYTAQTTWLRDTRATLNTVFITHVGDLVDNGTVAEYNNASASQQVLDAAGIPNAVLPGNHDFINIANYNAAFPVSRYSANSWYGGSMPGMENRDSYQLFSVGDLDFILVNLEYAPSSAARSWASGILAANPSRRAIVSTHDYLTGSGTRSANGNSMWSDVINGNCNVFLVLSGHYHPGEARLTSTNTCGKPVHQVVQDYQDDPNGGNGWLRYYTFKPSENTIYAYTYSPTLDQFRTGSASQFTLAYAMTKAPQTITFGPLADRRLDAGPAALSATASSGLPVTFASGTPAVCTVADDEVSLVAVGTCTITADQAGDATYAAAPRVSQDFSVTAVAPTVGYLRVTSSPAVPTQVSIDGVIADSWGLNWVKLAPGSYTVHFSHVEGYTEPADQQVTVTAGDTASVTGTFVRRGSLRVVTAPAVAGTVTIDGAARDDWGMWTDLPTGHHEVCFGPVAGYAAPACEDVTLAAGDLATVTGTYTADVTAPGPASVGYLRVTSSPAVPTQVSIDGVIADSWGLNWVKLAPGSYTVHFSHVEGYTEPADQQVTVTAGDTASVTGTFVRRGSLRVVTAPAVAGTVTVDGAARDDWGMWTDLPTGHHEVCFGPVAGYAAPACEDVTLAAGDLATVTGTYAHE